MRHVVVAIVALLLLTACDLAGPADRGEPGEAAVVFQRSGGIGGESSEWEIFPSGRVIQLIGPPEQEQTAVEWEVAAEEVQELVDNLAALGFFDLTGDYMPDEPCPDCFTYRLTVRSDGRTNTIETADAAPSVPEAAWESFRLVEIFINESRPQVET
ncbi:MAG TPA: protealysin inhibitor emfourin [Anaerolineae bacterium]